MFLLVLVHNLCTYAQHNPLRDSLKVATEALNYHPDSLDLRLKKASWNVQLGEWDYAKGEYDKVLAQEPNNISVLLSMNSFIVILLLAWITSTCSILFLVILKHSWD